MFNALLPKGAPFFELLLKQNEILCQIAITLAEVLGADDPTKIDKPHQKIATLEEEADALQLIISKHLSRSFITPIDREDIWHINQEQEDAIDFYHNLSNRIYIFEFKRIRFPMQRLGQTLRDMVLLTGSMLKGLSERRDSHDTRAFRALRTDCDMLLNMGLGELYDQKDPALDMLDILKWSRAYDRMELTVEQVVKLAETIEEAVLKNV